MSVLSTATQIIICAQCYLSNVTIIDYINNTKLLCQYVIEDSTQVNHVTRQVKWVLIMAFFARNRLHWSS